MCADVFFLDLDLGDQTLVINQQSFLLDVYLYLPWCLFLEPSSNLLQSVFSMSILFTKRCWQYVCRKLKKKGTEEKTEISPPTLTKAAFLSRGKSPGCEKKNTPADSKTLKNLLKTPYFSIYTFFHFASNNPAENLLSCYKMFLTCF